MKVQISAPVRQNEVVFEQYINSLNNLVVPDGVEVNRVFVFHNINLSSKLNLEDTCYFYHSEDEYEINDVTHVWTNKLVNQVAEMRNALIKIALEEDADYLFLVDSDLVLHPRTLEQLLSREKDIIANVFWTRWTPESPEMPNAWDFDHYTFKEGSLGLWRQPGVYQVGMAGACTLISRKVLESGVDYTKIPNVSLWGEDRHFCIRAACAGFDIYLDTVYPANHLYRPSDIGVIQNGNG